MNITWSSWYKIGFTLLWTEKQPYLSLLIIFQFHDAVAVLKLLSRCLSEVKSHEQQHRKFHSDTKENFVPIRVVKHWQKGPESLCDLHTWNNSKPSWTWPWANWSSWICSELKTRLPEVSYKFNYWIIISSLIELIIANNNNKNDSMILNLHLENCL